MQDKTMNNLFIDRLSAIEALAGKSLTDTALMLYHNGKIDIELAEELGIYNDIRAALVSGKADFISISQEELLEIGKILDGIESILRSEK